jgi:hypothetical protein
MTTAARRALKDCRAALAELEAEPTGTTWRLRWAGTLALLRAIGHVLEKLDSRNDAKARPIINELYKEWKMERGRAVAGAAAGGVEERLHQHRSPQPCVRAQRWAVVGIVGAGGVVLAPGTAGAGACGEERHGRRMARRAGAGKRLVTPMAIPERFRPVDMSAKSWRARQDSNLRPRD